MLGTLLNTLAILLGGSLALLTRIEIAPRRQLFLKMVIGVALVWYGLKIAITALGTGDWRFGGRLFLILLVSMIAGRLLGRLLRIQRAMNRLGQLAKERLSKPNPNDALTAMIILFCASPLGIVGAITDGLGNVFQPLLIKGLIDGLAAFSFARMFGWRVLVSALPMAALLGGMTFGAQAVEPWLHSHQLLDAVNIVAGFLVLYVSLIVFEVKKVELGDYLPALAVAPTLAWLFR